MRAVVSGASGFIGSHLVDGLLAAGYRVKALGRNMPGLIGKSALANPDLTTLSVDMSDRLALDDSIEAADVVFHLASGSLPQSSNRDPHADVQVNLLGALNLLEAARKAHVNRFVMVSSGGTVYGVPKHIPIPEDHSTEPTCSYGITKLAIEKYVELYRQLYGIDGVILRVANPYGERQRLDATQGVVPVFLGKALSGEPLQIFGDGETVRDFLHVSDVVTALIAASRYSGPQHIFNIGFGEGVSLNQLVKILECSLDRTFQVEYLPSRGFDVPTNVLCIDRARKYLNWSPCISVTEGITRLCDSFNG